MEAKKATTTGDPSSKEQSKTKHEPIHGTRIYSTSISVIVMHAARPGVDRSSIVSPFRFRGRGVGVAAWRVPAGKQEQERPTSGAYIARGARRPRNGELTTAASSSSWRAARRGERAPQLCSGFGPVGTSRLATP
jgi:hypothetical protein